MKLKDILLSVAGGLAVIAVFCPWYVMSLFGLSASANGFVDGVTIFGILSLLVGLGLIAWKLLPMFGVIKPKMAEQKIQIIDTCFGGALVLLGIIGMIVIYAQGQGLVAAGFGVYLLILSGIAAIVLTWLKIDKTVGKAPKPAKKTTTKTEKKD